MASKRPPKRHANAPGAGSRVTTEIKARFREEYLRSGNVSAAARAVKLPRSSCTALAEDAETDPAFVKARKDLLTRGLDRVETMLIRAAELASERMEEGPTVDGMGGIVDNGPQYFRGLSDAHRALAARRAKEMPEDGPKASPQVTIILKGAESQSVTTDPEPVPDSA